VPGDLSGLLETVERPDLDLSCFVMEAADELRLADCDELASTLGRWRNSRPSSDPSAAGSGGSDLGRGLEAKGRPVRFAVTKP
jgi:hypothetical protein